MDQVARTDACARATRTHHVGLVFRACAADQCHFQSVRCVYHVGQTHAH